MKRFTLMVVIFAVFSISKLNAQTAIDFTLTDCNGVSRNLFNTLDHGKVVIAVYEMQCTGSLNGCKNITMVMNNNYSTNTKIEIMYLDNAGHDCAATASWISANSLFPGTNFEYSSSYTSPYGTGMPVIVIAGGTEHDTYLVSLGASDTATIHNAIKQALADLETTGEAFDFDHDDCSGIPQNLYSYLDKNKVAVVVYEHQCGMCTAGSIKVASVMNNLYSSDTNISVMYFDNGGHDCASIASWVATNNLFPGLNFEYSGDFDSPYGAGMPVVVITGGLSHKVCLIAKNAQDTNAIHNAIECALTELTASVSDITADNYAFEIFPNPVSSENFVVHFDKHLATGTNMDIIDLFGNTVRSFTITGTDMNDQNVIGVSGLANGLYFLRVQAETHTIVKKFVIER